MIDRLTELELEGFRLFRDRCTVPLDGNVVLIHGGNGSGKSSFLSALEYALTGAVSDYARFEDDYPACLGHIHAQHPPRVMLRYRTAGGEFRTAVALETKSGSVLARPERRHFVERCYLSQARLARLLEAYQASDTEHADAPLVRFVRELLGLDFLENLAAGLYAAGHIRRIEKGSPELQRLRADSERLSAQIATLTERREHAREAWTQARARLAESLRDRADAVLPESSAGVSRLRAQLQGPESDESYADTMAAWSSGRARLRSALEALRVIEAAIDGLTVNPEARIREIRDRVDGLERQLRPLVEELEDELRELGILAADASGPGELGTRLAAIQASIDPALDRLRAELGAFVRGEAELRALQLRETKLREALARSPERASDALQSQIRWITTLEGALDHLHGDDCPVCGRNYLELDRGTLRNRVMEQLVRLETEASAAAGEARQREQVIEELTFVGRRVGALLDLRAREGSRYAWTEGALARLERAAANAEVLRPLSERWTQRQVELAEWTAAFEAGAARERQRNDALFDLERVAGELGLRFDLDAASPVEQGEAAVREIDRRMERSQALRAAPMELQKRLDAAEVAAQAFEHAELELSAAIERRTRLNEAQGRVNVGLHRARLLRNAAAKAQSSLLNQLFSDTLNELWSDLFQRLVPSERFEPRLVAETGSRGKIYAGMEGVADARTFKHLASVLSMGNLNTAALTLFLSLNLIEHPRNRVLILDDPVQSMDDVHVANLSNVIRSITYQTGRQVFIAVHERALFEFFQTDLAPAAENERMVVIELIKDQDGSSQITHRVLTCNPRGELLAG